MTDANTMVERLVKRAAKLNSLYNAMNATKKGDPDGNMLAEAAALIRSLAAERDEETDESLWRFWNAKARELATDNATLRKVLSEEGLTVNYQVDAVTKRLEAAEAEINRLDDRQSPFASRY